MRKLARRDFLKTASAATAAAAGAMTTDAFTSSPASAAAATAAADVKIGAAAYTPAKDYPIQPQRYTAVTLSDRFWKPKIATNATVTIPFQIAKQLGTSRGFNGNVLEAAMLSLKTHPDPQLQSQVDARVQQILLGTPRGNNGFEAAATWYQTSGKRDLLDQAIRTADEIHADFVQRNPPFNGGERDAMNCVQLYRATQNKQHLDLAKHYLDIRGLDNSVGRSRHNQSHQPVTEQREAVGHAVNGVTLMVSMADVGVLTGLREYLDASQRLWTDAVSRKMYVTGGVGATGNEGFGEAFALPNISAYSETCAVLMFMTLNQRLFMATGDSQYIDVMERGMYNNAVDGVSVSGNRFFYVNRLASAGDGRDARWERASLECCPPNLVRFFASMPGLIYAQDTRSGAIFVNLYVSSATTFDVAGGGSGGSRGDGSASASPSVKTIGLTVDSEMPYGGASKITVSAPKGSTAAAIRLRIPGWARNRPAPGGLYRYVDKPDAQPSITLTGQTISATPDEMGYVTIERTWKSGDVIATQFPIATRRVIADDRVVDTRRRMAIERGPIVFCAEWPEVDGGRALDLLVDQAAPLTVAVKKTAMSDATTVIEMDARRINQPQQPAKRVTLVPYHLWANRGPGEMSVWLPTQGYAIGDAGPAGGYIFYENPNYAADGWRYLEAAPFDQSIGATWGCFRRLIDGARGTAIGTGKQNTADMLVACAETGTAAHLCTSLNVNGAHGWFLPSRDELAALYRNLKAAGLGNFHDGGAADNVEYWASSQQTADMSVHIDFADLGRLHGDDKDFPRRVRAIRII